MARRPYLRSARVRFTRTIAMLALVLGTLFGAFGISPAGATTPIDDQNLYINSGCTLEVFGTNDSGSGWDPSFYVRAVSNVGGACGDVNFTTYSALNQTIYQCVGGVFHNIDTTWHQVEMGKPAGTATHCGKAWGAVYWGFQVKAGNCPGGRQYDDTVFTSTTSSFWC